MPDVWNLRGWKFIFSNLRPPAEAEARPRGGLENEADRMLFYMHFLVAIEFFLLSREAIADCSDLMSFCSYSGLFSRGVGVFLKVCH